MFSAGLIGLPAGEYAVHINNQTFRTIVLPHDNLGPGDWARSAGRTVSMSPGSRMAGLLTVVPTIPALRFSNALCPGAEQKSFSTSGVRKPVWHRDYPPWCHVKHSKAISYLCLGQQIFQPGVCQTYQLNVFFSDGMRCCINSQRSLGIGTICNQASV